MSDFNKLATAIRNTMVSIAFDHYYDAEEVPVGIENDVDVAFMTLEHCFPEFDCIYDTVTRRCAKEELYILIKQAREQSEDKEFDLSDFLEANVTAEEVLRDIAQMNGIETEE